MIDNAAQPVLGSGKLHCLLGVLLLSVMEACSTKIIAEGEYDAIPAQGTLVSVWSTHPTLEHTTILWLSQHGMRVVDPSEIRAQLSGAGNATLAPDEKSVLSVAETYDVREMVMVQLVGDQRAPAVLVRALSLPQKKVVWAGSARYEDYLSKPTANNVVVAVCRALAAAWRIPTLPSSERCMIEQGD